MEETKNNNITLTIQVKKPKDNELADILCAALEGGCDYWADECQVVGEYRSKDKNLYEHFTNGGTLSIHLLEGSIEEDGPEWFDFDKTKFSKGLEKYLEENLDEALQYMIEKDREKYFIDPCNVDSADADAILQYALFNEIVFC